MFAVIASVIVASAYAQTCAKPLDMCLKVGANFLCPNNQGCIINKINDNLSFCCAFADIVNTPATAAPKPTPCVDLLNPATGYSDCPQRAYLCNNQAYYQLMTEQCPRTCNRCNSQSNNGNNGNVGGTVPGGNTGGNTGIGGGVGFGGGNVGNSCVDKVNPSNGISDCPSRYMYCKNAAYLTLMRDQCPKTCGFC